MRVERSIIPSGWMRCRDRSRLSGLRSLTKGHLSRGKRCQSITLWPISGIDSVGYGLESANAQDSNPCPPRADGLIRSRI